MLEFKNVSKKYHIYKDNNREILDNVTFSIKSNQVTAILGESGSGKSTILNLIATFDNVDSGEILYKGKNIKKYKNKWKKDIISLIFQDYNLIDHLTVYENIEIAINQFKILNKKNKINDYLKLLNIEHIRNIKAKLLSGGEKQRVAIARSLIKNPDIILADEPTGSLDEINRELITNILLNLKSEGKTIIIVTHSDELAKRCDNILEIKNKKVNLIKQNKKNKVIDNIDKKNPNKINIPLKLSIKNFIQKKIRMLFVAFGTSIGLTAAIMIMGISNGVQQKIIEDANSFIRPDVINVFKLTENDDLKSGEIKYDEIKNISKIEGIEKIISKYDFNFDIILPLKANEEVNDIIMLQKTSVLYNNKYNVDFNFDNILYGRPPLNKYEIALNKKDAYLYLSKTMKEKNDDNLKSLINQEIEFSMYIYDFFGETNLPKEVDGQIINTNLITIKQKLKVTGIIKDSYLTSDGTASLITDKLANEILEKSNLLKISTSMLTVFVKEEKTVKSVMDKINELGFYAERQDETIKNVTNIIESTSNVLVGITMISIVVSSIMISIIMYINLLERRREIAILHSIGYSKTNIKSVFYLEALYLGITSVLFTISTSIFIKQVFGDLVYNNFDGASIMINTEMYVIICLISLFISIISSFIPLELTLRKNIINVLKNY